MSTNPELFAQAVRYHESGLLQQAERLYQQILQTSPGHAGALFFLGVIDHQCGRNSVALEKIGQAIALDPCVPAFHYNRGNILAQEGQREEAAASYQRALDLDPKYARAHCNLGTVRMAQERWTEALALFQEAARLEPGLAQAYYNMGQGFKQQRRWDEAAESYRRAVQINPQYGEAYYSLGVIQSDQGNQVEATESFRQALRYNPNHADALFGLGLVLDSRGDSESLECYRQALRINPNHLGAITNLGNAFERQGEAALAEASIRKALTLDPENADVHHNMSNALLRLGRLEEASRHNEQALRINPAHRTARWQRALLRLLRGDFTGAWTDFEQRWVLPNVAQRPRERPHWDGAPLEGRTIHVHAEQGLGDTIQFIRYLPLVKERGGTVLFECQSGLVKLLAGIAGPDRIIADSEPTPHHDVQVPLLSLPGIFKTTLATVPAAIPYLRADPEREERWRRELAPLEGFKVGIAWSGSQLNPGDRYRSIPVGRFRKLAELPGVRLISLQKGPGCAELGTLADVFPIVNLDESLDRDGAFLDTAAVLTALDLVITIDSAVAHLAGALAVPVWVLLPLTPDWRWLLDRADSPWYSTMRLFRQRRLGDWDEVVERVATELSAKQLCSVQPKISRG